MELKGVEIAIDELPVIFYMHTTSGSMAPLSVCQPCHLTFSQDRPSFQTIQILAVFLATIFTNNTFALTNDWEVSFEL